MRFTAIVAVIIIAASIVFAQTVVDGFKGNPWGTSKKGMQNVTFSGNMKDKRPEVTAYLVRVDSFGGVKPYSCAAWFFNDRLYGVLVAVKGREDFSRLLEACKSAYGEPTSSKPRYDEYQWKSASSDRLLEYRAGYEEGTLLMSSVVLTNELDSLYKEKAKIDSGDM